MEKGGWERAVKQISQWCQLRRPGIFTAPGPSRNPSPVPSEPLGLPLPCSYGSLNTWRREGERGVQLSSTQIPRPAYPHPLPRCKQLDGSFGKQVSWVRLLRNFPFFLSFFSGLKNRSFLCSVRGDREDLASAAICVGFCLMEKGKSFSSIGHAFLWSAYGSHLCLSFEELLVYEVCISYLPTYVGTYKFVVPLCVQNIIMRMLLGHGSFGY